jgi:hypothetical protein
MIPDKPTVLEGKSLKDFEEYQTNITTKKELDWKKEAIKHHKSYHIKCLHD